MSTQDKIRNRLRRRGLGSVFSPSDFADLGSRAAVDQALSRLAKGGTLRRLDRGIYDSPKTSARVGVRSPDADKVAQAAVRRLGARLQRSGAVAAHALGLSDQVPARPVYYTDAPSRTIQAGKRKVFLRHAGPRSMLKAGTISGDVHHALRFIGRDAIDDRVIDDLRKRLTDQDKRQLLSNLTGFPAWVQDVMRRVATG